jgi:dTDP-4-amino-4,6-dideoxygalactose transaminase
MRISRKTRAVVVCHLYGNPAEARGLRALCDRHGLALIEDLSHAPGATLDGKPVGAFGDLAFISFQGRKAISGGEGGALLCRSPNHYQRAMELGQPKRLFRLPPACRTYDRVSRGYKFRISALHAFIAYLSFQRLPRTNATRAAMCGSLRERLAKIPYVRLTQVPAGGERVYFRNELFVTGGETERERVVKALRASALPARGPDYEYLPSLRPFRRHFRPVGCLPNAERNLAALIVLPPFTAYRRRIVDVYAKVMQSLV